MFYHPSPSKILYKTVFPVHERESNQNQSKKLVNLVNQVLPTRLH